MLRIHLMQNWFGDSHPAMEDALYEMAPLRKFAGLSLARGSVPDEITILNFRRLLETHDLAPKMLASIDTHLTDKVLLLHQGTIVDATIIHAAPSTQNKAKARDPEMYQTRKGDGEESSAVPTAPVDDTVHGAVRDRGEVPPRVVSLALAEGAPRLFDEVRRHMRVKHYSLRSEQIDIGWTSGVHLGSKQ